MLHCFNVPFCNASLQSCSGYSSDINVFSTLSSPTASSRSIPSVSCLRATNTHQFFVCVPWSDVYTLFCVCASLTKNLQWENKRVKNYQKVKRETRQKTGSTIEWNDQSPLFFKTIAFFAFCTISYEHCRCTVKK